MLLTAQLIFPELWQNPVLTTAINKTDVLCNGGSTGIITVTQPTTGTAPYQYSLNGITFQPAIYLMALLPVHILFYRESNGCQGRNLLLSPNPLN
jgi:hypothetical protein